MLIDPSSSRVTNEWVIANWLVAVNISQWDLNNNSNYSCGLNVLIGIIPKHHGNVHKHMHICMGFTETDTRGIKRSLSAYWVCASSRWAGSVGSIYMPIPNSFQRSSCSYLENKLKPERNNAERITLGCFNMGPSFLKFGLKPLIRTKWLNGPNWSSIERESFSYCSRLQCNLMGNSAQSMYCLSKCLILVTACPECY